MTDKNNQKPKFISEEERQNFIQLFGTDDFKTAKKLIKKNDNAVKKLEKMIKNIEEK